MTAGDVVRTPAGTVVGRRTGRVRRFLGIPYAEAPFGVRRFAAPVPRGRFTEPYDASRHGATAQQVPLFTTTTIPEPSVPGEDVLNLSVVAPADADRCPVLVWIHGGGFLAGSPASPWYDGRSFARDGVVTVTVGYRLGVDGFAPLDGVPANLGLRDVLLALDWVRENIAAFGGDPGRVTLAGQSAGGAAVLALLSSPAAEGRFQQAVSISGGLFEVRRDTARGFLGRLGRRLAVPPTREGFGGVAMDRLQEAVRDLRGGETLVLGPVTGDDILPVSIAEGLTGHGLGTPVLLGSTGDEFDGGGDGDGDGDGDGEFDGRDGSADGDGLCGREGGGVGGFHGRYDGDEFGGDNGNEGRPAAEFTRGADTAARSARAAGTRVTDVLFRSACPRVAHSRRKAGAGTWLYSFEWPSPVTGGATHCVDLPFFYDLLDAPGVREALGPCPPAELAALMHADLVGFVHGRPPSWAPATGGPGDPVREYGRPGAVPAADTTGGYDPVVRSSAEAC
ncbi:carboxylesterase family protein [Streptomyces fuscichromogenes]|uniref:Carboxylic ester hydrolase n=1 Tax=Streptomyces fuscichromogenes TaxID=1324013 RepID=A0A917XI09_9ACTN|nr:carboxylesterase family protein [Streptomyces fuscichromogenes]GGN28460.1 carboxylic ester hydrolase [Streptomyces fuscichromogenes]